MSGSLQTRATLLIRTATMIYFKVSDEADDENRKLQQDPGENPLLMQMHQGPFCPKEQIQTILRSSPSPTVWTLYVMLYSAPRFCGLAVEYSCSAKSCQDYLAVNTIDTFLQPARTGVYFNVKEYGCGWSAVP